MEEQIKVTKNFQIDPVEQAVVEATWGKVLIQDNTELLRGLGAMPIRQILDKQPGRFNHQDF